MQNVLKFFLAASVLLCALFSCSTQPDCNQGNTEGRNGNLGNRVNSPENDFAPMVDSHGELYFTSDRNAGPDDYITERVYHAPPSGGLWQTAKEMGSTEPGSVNLGTMTVSRDGGVIIVSRAHDATHGGLGGADLFEATKTDGRIGGWINLGPNVNSPYWDAQPALSKDGKVLVFSSERPSGRGGADLWMSTRSEDGQWARARNLGPVINTAGNEYSPYLTELQGKLFLMYATDGRTDGMGETDLYYASSKDGITWSSPKSVTSLCPIANSSGPDMFPALNPTENLLLFCSDRPGGCGGLDHYAAPFHFPGCRIRGIVRDSTTGEPLVVETSVLTEKAATGETVGKMTTSLPASSFSQELSVAGTFRVVASARRFYPGTPIDISVAPDETVDRDLYLVPMPQSDTIANLNMQSATIPFYVTGYYRLNVPEQLTELRSMLDTKLRKASYIARKEALSDEYMDYATVVKQLFEDSIITPLTREVFPKFRPGPGDYLEIRVAGYADPRDIGGDARYVEQSVTVKEIGGSATTIPQNSRLNNKVLSQLRAYFAMRYIDEQLRNTERTYNDLRKAGMVRYSLHGAGVDKSNLEFAARRRVQVLVRWHRAGE